ncbi:MAG: hypothetical protein HS122_08420 [Opitutaceae bacterium]|nr:hypothetical protein [Opitutaceae bacterium]
MAAIDESIVREYFEQNGFLVRQMRKYQVTARRKTTDEEIDLLVYNPAWQRGERKPDFFLFVSELKFLHQAVVAIKPWHTDVFTPGMLKNSPEIFRFLEGNVMKQAARFFPKSDGSDAAAEDGEEITRVLVLPSLPTQEPYRSQSVQMLKERGVDGIISFRAMLQDLIENIETNLSYRKSDTLQVMRILKNYDLLKDPQMDLLSPKPKS